MGNKISAEDFWEKTDDCLSELNSSFGTEYVLMPALRLLRQGAEEGEPVLMYLWAEFLLWGSYTADEGYSTYTFREMMPEDEEVQRAAEESLDYCDPDNSVPLSFTDEDGCFLAVPDAYKWYARSAKAGYVPAGLWLAWCAKRGIVTKPDEEESRRWLDHIRKLPVVSELLPCELDKFVEWAIELGRLSYAADLDEDIAADQGCHFSGPSWKDLLRSSMTAYILGCMMGSPRCALPIYELQAYDYDRCDSIERRRMCVEKRMWQIWCGLNGIGVKEAAPEQLLAWCMDIDHAVEYDGRPMKLDEKTKELLHELTEEILRRQ